MGVEKEGLKSGGGYVGGFFQLFDWSAKSRKKLFSSKSDLPERPKQGKKNDGNLPMSRLHLVDEDETGAGDSIRGGSDYSCASSVTDDDSCGAKAPGVVARLMGLETLPMSNYSEPYSTPFFDTRSLQDAQYRRKNIDYHDQDLLYSGNLLNTVEGPVRNFVESKPRKMLSRPIEKFQTEVLPPKSAKSIPITHHKLLSPIKSPGFIPSKNAAHIMEAAAKIIEPGPQATAKAKMPMPLVGSSSVPLKVRDFKEKMEAGQRTPLVGSSSVPLKVRDLKEKVEAAHKTSRTAEALRRPVESNAAKHLKGQFLNKSWNGSVDTISFRSSDTEEGSSGSKNKGKSISLAIQAKVNVQRRGGLNSSSSRSIAVGQREQTEARSSQPFKSQPNIQKNRHKKSSTHNVSGVLRQNNQKQNCIVDKDKLPSKPSVSNLQGRKVLSGDPSPGWHKTSGKTVGNSKTGSRKFSLDVTDGEKGVSYSGTKNLPRKKRLINGEFHFEKNQIAENKQKAAQSNPVVNRHIGWAEDSKSKGTDVISFTFTAPLTRSLPGSETCGQVEQKSDSACNNRAKRLLLDAESGKLSSLGYNFIGGDALSMLLEQKLKELSYGVEVSYNGPAKVGSSSSFASILPNLIPGTTSWLDKRNQHVPLADKLDSHCDSDFSSSNPSPFRLNHKFQGVDEMDECSSNHADARPLVDCRQPSPVSILEHSFSTESCNSSDSTDSSCVEGTKQCSSVQAQEVLGLNSLKKFGSVEADIELSDSASSTSTSTICKRDVDMIIVTETSKSTNWELDYVKQICSNVELMFKDFALGRAREVVNPLLFNQLESRKGGLEGDGAESRLRRKALFDCVSECLDARCRHYVGGGCRPWAKGMTMVQRKEWLAEEVYKEISGWTSMRDCMVDELVDKDMSSQHGRWLDFEVDAFVIGTEIDGLLFNSLVDEVMADFLRI